MEWFDLSRAGVHWYYIPNYTSTKILILYLQFYVNFCYVCKVYCWCQSPACNKHSHDLNYYSYVLICTLHTRASSYWRSLIALFLESSTTWCMHVILRNKRRYTLTILVSLVLLSLIFLTDWNTVLYIPTQWYIHLLNCKFGYLCEFIWAQNLMLYIIL